jgi:hypothetical protein
MLMISSTWKLINPPDKIQSLALVDTGNMAVSY